MIGSMGMFSYLEDVTDSKKASCLPPIRGIFPRLKELMKALEIP